MTDRELMQMALEALDSKHDMTKAEWRVLQYHAFTALRARLAQPEHEPNPWRFAAQRLGEDLSTVGPDGYYNMSASEWLDWAMKHITPARIEQDDGYCQACDGNYCTAKDGCVARDNPPQREWQGLTKEEYEAMAEKCVTNCYFDTLKYARAIEARLRDKNS